LKTEKRDKLERRRLNYFMLRILFIKADDPPVLVLSYPHNWKGQVLWSLPCWIMMPISIVMTEV